MLVLRVDLLPCLRAGIFFCLYSAECKPDGSWRSSEKV
uniref:Mago binding protein n=1 Tax=Myoviridae sp. ctro722 TaxID=2827615 RepID=A0A8S5LMA1_9CAUD|nr:MAG TPA: Mago binding protein [Myoviridae sp. ctro722]